VKTLLMLGIAFVTLSLAGCAHQHSDDRYYDRGPPPHAPAHGYRAKHHRHNMMYDNRLGAYVVLGYDDHYYLDDRYYRYRDGGWWFNVDIDSRDWRHIDANRVPHKLRKSQGGKGKQHKHKKHSGKGKNKHDDKGRH